MASQPDSSSSGLPSGTVTGGTTSAYRRDPATTVLVVEGAAGGSLKAVLQPLQSAVLQAVTPEAVSSYPIDTEPVCVLVEIENVQRNLTPIVAELRRHHTLSRVPILAVGPRPEAPEDLVAAYVSGVVDYVERPFEVDHLRAKIEAFVDLFSIRKQTAMEATVEQQAGTVDDKALMAALSLEMTARRESDRSLRMNELFLGILGHDLRNPMSAIAMGASLLMRTLGGKELHAARRIAASAERMGRMIDQLLDFTRIRSGGGLVLNLEKTDLGRLCRGVVDEHDGPGERLSLQITGDTSGLWDPDRLVQLLSNLVGNALDHGTPDEPVTVQVTGDAQAVTLSIENGGRIPPHLVPILFEPFQGSHRRGKRSLGLGLFISQQIAEAHGGSIVVEPTGSRHTRFCIKLPRQPAP